MHWQENKRNARFSFSLKLLPKNRIPLRQLLLHRYIQCMAVQIVHTFPIVPAVHGFPAVFERSTAPELSQIAHVDTVREYFTAPTSRRSSTSPLSLRTPRFENTSQSSTYPRSPTSNTRAQNVLKHVDFYQFVFWIVEDAKDDAKKIISLAVDAFQ